MGVATMLKGLDAADVLIERWAKPMCTPGWKAQTLAAGIRHPQIASAALETSMVLLAVSDLLPKSLLGSLSNLGKIRKMIKSKRISDLSLFSIILTRPEGISFFGRLSTRFLLSPFALTKYLHSVESRSMRKAMEKLNAMPREEVAKAFKECCGCQKFVQVSAKTPASAYELSRAHVHATLVSSLHHGCSWMHL